MINRKSNLVSEFVLLELEVIDSLEAFFDVWLNPKL